MDLSAYITASADCATTKVYLADIHLAHIKKGLPDLSEVVHGFNWCIKNHTSCGDHSQTTFSNYTWHGKNDQQDALHDQ